MAPTGNQKEALLSALVDGLGTLPSYVFDCPLRVFLPNGAISDCMLCFVSQSTNSYLPPPELHPSSRAGWSTVHLVLSPGILS